MFPKVLCSCVWRSGHEGVYPHLIQFCESHLEKLDPQSRALRKENPVATSASLSEEEWSHIVDDLKVCHTLLYHVLSNLLSLIFLCHYLSHYSWIYLLNVLFCALQTWQEETKMTEASLKQEPMFGDLMKENMPPVRGSSCSVAVNKVNMGPNNVTLYVYCTKWAL